VLRLDRSGAITPVPFSSSQGISRESAG
jgi:hypothetical protein